MRSIGKNTKKIVILICLLIVILSFILLKYIDTRKTTILYSTDISIDGDFDDYFDLVAIQALDNIDLKIIVDGNNKIQKQSGKNAIDNLNKILGGGIRGAK